MFLRLIIGFLASLILGPSLHAQYGKVTLPLGPNGTSGTLHYFKFSAGTHTLKVVDQGTGAPLYRDLDSAMRANGCVAGCNGGFFHRNGKPLGLVISNGRVQGSNNLDSSLTSGTIYVENGSIRLVRSSVFSAKRPPLPRHVLQTGPYLVEGSRVVAGLSPKRFSRRSLLATDGKGNWMIAYTPPTTLAQLGAVLSKKGVIAGFQISHAINLDGGSSSGLWVRKDNNPLYFREVSKVRNFIGVTKK